jgi:hypothetical protein
MNNVSMPPVDIKDPRIRVTFADVAMKFASDGPMYGVIVLVGVLALKGTTTAAESITGAALALLARSHPPPETGKRGPLGALSVGVGVMLVGGAVLAACGP